MTENDFSFTVTQDAAKKIKELSEQEKEGKKYLRISVDGGGCSGFMYKYDFTNKTDDQDKIIKYMDCIILIDSISQDFLNGSKIDYIQDLGSEYFQISNPKAKYKCGCGNSFGL